MRPEGVRLISVGDKAALVENLKLVAKTQRKEKSQKIGEPDNIVEVVQLYGMLME